MKKIQKHTKKRSQVAHHVRHALVPHKGNKFRPHLVRLHGLTVVLVIAMVFQVAYGVLTTGRLEVLGRVSTIDASQLLAETNQERVQQSLPELSVNETLNQAAQLKARDMFQYNYWAHTSPTGVSPWEWLGKVGYEYSVAGENLAKNYPTAPATVDAWMASESHKANILNGDYTDVGFAVVDGMIDGRDTTIVVAFYGAPSSPTVAGVDTRPQVFAAPINEGVGNPITYFGSALQSLTPATLGTLALFTLVGAVAIAAHHYRNRLPAAWRKSWRVHHGMYTFVGIAGLAVLMILATGGGQI